MKSNKHKALVLLGLISILVRVLLWFYYQPIVYNDTPLYTDLASYIQGLDFSGYQGERTPGYPLLLLLGGLNYQVVWFFQSVLGLLISFILFAIAWHRTKSAGFALLIGLSYTLSVNQLFFEASILTETLSTFCVVLSLLLLLRMYDQKNSTRILFYCLGLGLTLALGVLTRPIILALVPLYFIWITRRYWGTVSTVDRAKYLVAYAAPIIIIVLGWSLFNRVTIGYFGLTTLSGYTWMEHSGSLIQFAPDEYAQIQEVYQEFRQKQIAQGRSETGTIWRAFSTMMDRTGLSYVELSEELHRMSMGLLREYPAHFARNFIEMWHKFWEPANYWLVEEITNPQLAEILKLVWYIQGVIWILIKYLFWGIAIYYMVALFFRERDFDFEFNLLLIGIVLSVSVLQAVAGGYGDNHRYSIPFDPLILYVVFVSARDFFSRLSAGEVSQVFSSQRSSVRSVLQNLVLVVVLTLVLLEGAARLVWWDRQVVDNLFGKEVELLPQPLVSDQQLAILESWAESPDRYIQFDPVLGWSVRPNAQGRQEGVIYSSNSAGMRSLRDYPLEKPAGKLRIGTFGPSFTHGDEVPDEGTWQAQMEQARPDLEVMNWGVGGYGTDQAFLRYRAQGAAYRPEIVVIGIEEDNLRRNVNRFRPFFRPQTGTPLTKPVFVEEGEELVLLENPFDSIQALQQGLLGDPNQFLDLVCSGDFYCDRERYRSTPLDIFYSYRFFRTLAYEINRTDQPQLASIEDPYIQRVNLLLVQKFVTEVVANGATPIILIFPERASMEAHERGEAASYQAGILLLRDQGLPVIDLGPAFVHAKITQNGDYGDYYASEGGHFNELGNYIVSQTVLGYLCQLKFLENCEDL